MYHATLRWWGLMQLCKIKNGIFFDVFIKQRPSPLPQDTNPHTQACRFRFSVTSLAQKPVPGLTRDPAWCCVLLSANRQHAQEWDQSTPKYEKARYIKPIFPRLYPLSSPPLGSDACQRAWQHRGAAGETLCSVPSIRSRRYSQNHTVHEWQKRVSFTPYWLSLLNGTWIHNWVLNLKNICGLPRPVNATHCDHSTKCYHAH